MPFFFREPIARLQTRHVKARRINNAPILFDSIDDRRCRPLVGRTADVLYLARNHQASEVPCARTAKEHRG